MSFCRGRSWTGRAGSERKPLVQSTVELQLQQAGIGLVFLGEAGGWRGPPSKRKGGPRIERKAHGPPIECGARTSELTRSGAGVVQENVDSAVRLHLQGVTAVFSAVRADTFLVYTAVRLILHTSSPIRSNTSLRS